MACSNAAKTLKPLKVAGVPQTPEKVSAASRPKFTTLREHMEEILVLNKFFFPIVDTCLSSEDIGRQVVGWCADGDFFASFLRPVFSASRV